MPRVGAILLAAGLGRRFGGATPKALVPLKGRPLFVHSLRAFRQIASIREIVLTVPRGLEGRFRRKAGAGVTVLRGGRRRQDSVERSLEALSEACDVVVIHDTARPLVQPTDIRRVLRNTIRGGSLCAEPTTDTIKRVKGQRVALTLDRSQLWNAQTPQAFDAKIFRRTFKLARRRGWQATDCAGLVERAGYTVRVVRSSGPNIKITSRADLALAEQLLRRK